MILISGFDANSQYVADLSKKFDVQNTESVQEAVSNNLLTKAEAFVIGPAVTNPARLVQQIFAADKHLAVIILTPVIHFKQVKQNIQLAPFVGNNALVVAINPELDLTGICNAAINRTKQKRNFRKLNITGKSVGSPAGKTKLADMGTYLEYAPIGAILLNESKFIVNFNRKAKKYFPELEFIDRELNSILSANNTKVITEFIHSNPDPEECVEMNINNKILQLTTSEVYDEEGSKHFLLLFNDITDHRQEMQRIRAILESIPQMAWTTDADGNVTYFTQGWYFYTGQTPEHALGTGWTSVVFSEDVERLMKNWYASLKTGKPFQQAVRYRNTKNEYRWHLVRASPIRENSGQIIMWVGTSTDVHDQVQLTEELERKVKERTKSLEITNTELEQFAHVSSHDLQEPLRKIRTFAELLKDGADVHLNDTSKRYIDKINTTAERMSNSLKALLNYTRLRKEERFTTVDLNETIAHVLVDLELMISQRSATIDVKPLPVITASPIQMQQLFYNLINNSLKFSLKDVPPKIEISSREMSTEELTRFPQLLHSGEYYEISVKDNGIGFDEQYAAKIFTIFQRLHSQTEYEGTGIGLSLVKKVVSNHGGEIVTKSQRNKGTTFLIILPADQTKAAKVTSP